MIEIIGAVPDPSDSYFFGDFPAWCGWVAGLSFIFGIFFINRNEKVASACIAIGVWLPLVLINLERPIVLIIVTVIAFYCVKNFWREEFGEPETTDSRPEPFEGKFNEKDERDGYWIEWYDMDRKRKKSHAFYRDGKMISCEVWKPNGDKCDETKIIDGNGIMVQYWDSIDKDGTFHKDYEFEYKEGEMVDGRG